MRDRFDIARRRRELRDRAVAFLGGRCSICKYDRSTAAFDFHHLDPLEKDFTISSKMTSWSTIQPELEKCVLLCCRCHREVHDGLHPGYLVHEGSNAGEGRWNDYEDDLDEDRNEV